MFESTDTVGSSPMLQETASAKSASVKMAPPMTLPMALLVDVGQLHLAHGAAPHRPPRRGTRPPGWRNGRWRTRLLSGRGWGCRGAWQRGSFRRSAFRALLWVEGRRRRAEVLRARGGKLGGYRARRAVLRAPAPGVASGAPAHDGKAYGFTGSIAANSSTYWPSFTVTVCELAALPRTSSSVMESAAEGQIPHHERRRTRMSASAAASGSHGDRVGAGGDVDRPRGTRPLWYGAAASTEASAAGYRCRSLGRVQANTIKSPGSRAA